MMDQLVICKHCGGNACYEQDLGDGVKTWMDFGCGFTTSTVMKEGSEAVQAAIETAPELYKALMYTDTDRLVWLPATITLPNKGMVFVDGTTAMDWKWAAVKAIPLAKGDKKITKEQTHKMDMKNAQHFEQKDFMSALEVIGFYDIE